MTFDNIPATLGGAVAQARSTLDLITKLGALIDLPTPAVQARQQYDRVRDLTPGATGGPAGIADAFLADDVEGADRIAASIAARKALTEGHQIATQRAGKALRSAISNAAPDIHAALKAQAEPLIEHLHDASQQSKDAATLLREGDPDAARLVADADTAEMHLRHLYKLRDRVWEEHEWGAQVGFRCGMWVDPTVDVREYNVTDPTSLVGLIRRGRTLWFPDPSEAYAAAQVFRDQWNTEQMTLRPHARDRKIVVRG